MFPGMTDIFFINLLISFFEYIKKNVAVDTFGLDKVLEQVKAFAHTGMAHDTCVTECQQLISALALFCDPACTT